MLHPNEQNILLGIYTRCFAELCFCGINWSILTLCYVKDYFAVLRRFKVYSDIPCWSDHIYGSLHQGWQASTYILGVDAKFLPLNSTFNSFFSVQELENRPQTSCNICLYPAEFEWLNQQRAVNIATSISLQTTNPLLEFHHSLLFSEG